MVSPRGLLTLTPLCVLGVVGVVALRRRRAAEAVLVAGLTVVFLAYNAGYTLSFGGPFGGDSPGPRFLIALMPFLIFPIGLAARQVPGAAAVLLGASSAMAILSTSTVPMVGEGETHRWIASLEQGQFTHTLLTFAGAGSGWPSILPFVVLAAGLAAVGIRQLLRGALPLGMTALQACCALVSWLLVLFASGRLFEGGTRGSGLLALALALGVGAAAGLWRVPPSREIRGPETPVTE
jgi:hypothetical protein